MSVAGSVTLSVIDDSSVVSLEGQVGSSVGSPTTALSGLGFDDASSLASVDQRARAALNWDTASDVSRSHAGSPSALSARSSVCGSHRSVMELLSGNVPHLRSRTLWSNTSTAMPSAGVAPDDAAPSPRTLSSPAVNVHTMGTVLGETGPPSGASSAAEHAELQEALVSASERSFRRPSPSSTTACADHTLLRSDNQSPAESVSSWAFPHLPSGQPSPLKLGFVATRFFRAGRGTGDSDGDAGVTGVVDDVDSSRGADTGARAEVSSGGPYAQFSGGAGAGAGAGAGTGASASAPVGASVRALADSSTSVGINAQAGTPRAARQCGKSVSARACAGFHVQLPPPPPLFRGLAPASPARSDGHGKPQTSLQGTLSFRTNGDADFNSNRDGHAGKRFSRMLDAACGAAVLKPVVHRPKRRRNHTGRDVHGRVSSGVAATADCSRADGHVLRASIAKDGIQSRAKRQRVGSVSSAT